MASIRGNNIPFGIVINSGQELKDIKVIYKDNTVASYNDIQEMFDNISQITFEGKEAAAITSKQNVVWNS